MTSRQTKIFCFGLGYSALNFIHKELSNGGTATGTVRSLSKQQTLKKEGVNAVLFEDTHAVVAALEAATHIVHSVPATGIIDPVYDTYLNSIKKLNSLRWFAYLSTTGVYGDHGGAWVDETTQASPFDQRTMRRAAAEQAWLASGLPANVFRLSGIYGPGRNVLQDVIDGEARSIFKPGQVFSRIHVDDIAETLSCAMKSSSLGEIYNVCDDEPAPSHEVVAYACQLLGRTPPPLQPYEEAGLSEMALSFYRCNRRVSNRKIKETLAVKLHYPTYREGLNAIAKQLLSGKLAEK